MMNFTIDTLVYAIISTINDELEARRFTSGVSDKSIIYVNQNEFGGTERTMELAGRICDIVITFDDDTDFIKAQLSKEGTLTITSYNNDGTIFNNKTYKNFCRSVEVKRLAKRLSRYVDDEGLINDLFINAIDNSRDEYRLNRFINDTVNYIVNYCNPDSEYNKAVKELFAEFNVVDDYDNLDKYITDEEYRKIIISRFSIRPEIKNPYIVKQIEEKAIVKCRKILEARV